MAASSWCSYLHPPSIPTKKQSRHYKLLGASMWPRSALVSAECWTPPWSLLECQRGLKTSHTSKQLLNLSSVGMSHARAQACAPVCFAHTCMCDVFLRGSACMPTCVYMPLCACLGVCVCVCVCWEYVLVLFNFKDAGTLCCVRLHADRLSLMNNYLQQCKTNPLIMMRRWATFQHDSPRRLLCSTLICVTQSCLWINNNATFLSAPSGMLSCSFTHL